MKCSYGLKPAVSKDGFGKFGHWCKYCIKENVQQGFVADKFPNQNWRDIPFDKEFCKTCLKCGECSHPLPWHNGEKGKDGCSAGEDTCTCWGFKKPKIVSPIPPRVKTRGILGASL